MNPDISQKTIGSNNGPISRFLPGKFDDVLAQATTVIVGEVIEDDILYTFDLLGDNVKPDVDKPLTIKGAGKGTIARVHVLKTIAGIEPSQDIIQYYQLGAPETNTLQTKVEKGRKYILILKYYPETDRYGATAFEESVFLMDSSDKLISMSNLPFCARYDGIDKKILIEDVLSSKFFK